MRRRIISSVSPESAGSTTFPSFARFYHGERNLLSYKDGAVPFFLKLDQFRDNSLIAQIAQNLADGRRVPKGFIFGNFNVYKLDDLGSQSLSPASEDFSVLLFEGTNGHKIPQKDVFVIKNFTTKQAFVMFPKSIADGVNVTALVIESRPVQSSEDKVQLTKSGSVFEGNLSSIKADSLDQMSIYAREGSTDYEITNSEEFVSLARASFPEISDNNTFVARQADYFEKLQRSQAQSKATLNTVSTIATGLLGSSAYASSKQSGPDHYYGTLGTINSSYSSSISQRGILEVYELLGSGLMKKLIEGYHYWIGSNGQLNVNGATSLTKLEVFVRKQRSRKLVSSFDFSTGNSYDLHKALYYSYIKDWKVDKANSRIRIYKNGLLVKSHDASGSYTEYTFAQGTYEYIIEDYGLTTISTPSSDTNTVSFHYNNITVQSRTSLAFNKYQISTDPHLTTDGTLISADRSSQDVFLYDGDAGFRIDSSEPKLQVGYTGSTVTSYTVNELVDPYAGSFPGIVDTLETYQDGTVILGYMGSSANVQAIESSIASLKRNFLAMVENSSITYSSGSSSTEIDSDFLFLVIKGISSSNTFDIVYYNGSGGIIKKEYGCKCVDSPIVSGSDTLYVSVPHFEFDHAKLERASSFSYHAFK